MSTVVGRADLDLGLNYRQFNKELNGIVPKATSLIKGSFGKLGLVAGAAFSVKAAIGFGKASIAIASDLQEVQNVVDVTFGSMNNQINYFAKNALKQFGLSELSAKKYSSTMGAMLKSSGLTGQAVTSMSVEMTKLSADMASFYNLNGDEAFNKIRAGISGETEPLKQLGINMNVANLEAYALSQGIKKSYQQMSQAEQVLLRYNYLLNVSKDAQGDFARNIGSWANQTRILSEQWNTLKGTMGQAFMTMLAPVVKGINLLIQKLQTAANYFKAFIELIFGKKAESNDAISKTAESAEQATEGIGGVGKAAKKAGKEAKKGLMGFDEINNLMEDAAGSAGDLEDSLGGAGTADFGVLPTGEIDLGEDAITASIQRMFNSIGNQWSEFLNTFKPQLDGLKVAFGTLFDNIGELGRTFFEGFSLTATSIFSSVFNAIVSITTPLIKLGLEIVKTFIDSINGFLSTNMESIKTVITQAWELIRVGVTTIIDGLALWVKDIFNGLLVWWQGHSTEITFLLTETWNTIWLALQTIWTIIYDIGMNIFENLKAFFEEHSAKVSEVIVSAWDLIYTALSSAWAIILLAAQTIFGLLKVFWGEWGDEILRIFNSVWDLVSEVFNFALDFLLGSFEVFRRLFAGDWRGAWEECMRIGQILWDDITRILTSIWDGLVTTVTEFGTNIVEGLWNGIESMISWITGKVTGFVEGIAKVFTDFFDINSPSGLAKGWGKNIDEGLALGVTENAHKPIDAIKAVGAQMLAEAQTVIQAVTSTLSNSNSNSNKNKNDSTKSNHNSGKYYDGFEDEEHTSVAYTWTPFGSVKTGGYEFDGKEAKERQKLLGDLQDRIQEQYGGFFDPITQTLKKTGGTASMVTGVAPKGSNKLEDIWKTFTDEEKNLFGKTTKEKFGNNFKGTDFWKGGLTWVGEKGPELLNLPRGSQILSNKKSLDFVESFGAGFRQPELSIATGGNSNNRGNSLDLNDPSLVDKLMSIIATAISAANNILGGNSNNSSQTQEIILEIEGIKIGRVLLPIMNQEADRLGFKPILQYE